MRRRVWYTLAMDKYLEELDVVDEQDRVIGQASRMMVHKEGLLHREVHVYFFNAKGEILFQKRGSDVDMNPNVFHSSVGGHVDMGQTYDETALREIQEETGLTVHRQDLVFLKKVHYRQEVPSSGLINNALRSLYAYRFDGNIAMLKIEEGKSIGFEYWPIERLRHLTVTENKKFYEFLVTPEMIALFERVSALVK